MSRSPTCTRERAVVDQELADNPAGRVLDLLDARFHDQRACRDHGAGKLGGGADHADAEHQEQRRRCDGDEMGANGTLGSGHRRDFPPRSTFFSLAAAAAGVTCCRIWSRAPNACTRPSLSTRI